MTHKIKSWFVLFIGFMYHNCAKFSNGEPLVPCYFIFGDSLADNGNNNNLITSAKANYAPYGIDFPDGLNPTGRFTNSRTEFDFIGEFLGFEDFIPAFASTSTNITKGLNYASGASGIRGESGQQLGARVSLNRQILNHQVTVARLSVIFGNKTSALNYLNQCLNTIIIGSNDYINNYFMPEFYPTSRLYTTDQYATLLVQQYNLQLKTLYYLGARKFALFGIGLIGCTLSAISTFGNSTQCANNLNIAAEQFNTRLVSLIDQLNANLTDANFIYINSTNQGLGDPAAGGFTVVNVSCCPVRSDGQCVPSATPCQNRTTYVFWDSFHPTEAFNFISAIRSYNASIPFDAYPINIQTLAML